jgi:hypothetical protein
MSIPAGGGGLRNGRASDVDVVAILDMNWFGDVHWSLLPAILDDGTTEGRQLRPALSFP